MKSQKFSLMVVIAILALAIIGSPVMSKADNSCHDASQKAKEAADHFGKGEYGTAAERLGEALAAGAQCAGLISAVEEKCVQLHILALNGVGRHKVAPSTLLSTVADSSVKAGSGLEISSLSDWSPWRTWPDGDYLPDNPPGDRYPPYEPFSPSPIRTTTRFNCTISYVEPEPDRTGGPDEPSEPGRPGKELGSILVNSASPEAAEDSYLCPESSLVELVLLAVKLDRIRLTNPGLVSQLEAEMAKLSPPYVRFRLRQN